MIEPKRPLKIFLCHAHADRDPVRGLYDRLTKDGVDAWLDKEKLLPGQDWELEIRKAVREADVVVVCLSKQFNQAGFRQKEVRLALDTAMEQPEGEIFIIPARLEECDVPERLQRYQRVVLFEDDEFEKLMRALQTRAGSLSAKASVPKLGITKEEDFISSPDVNRAIENMFPVVAFESSFLTHGLPRPWNLQLARDIERIVRDEGATPAIVAFLDSWLHIGLMDVELERLANDTDAFKAGPRDFATFSIYETNGGTTVAGTILACKYSSIKILAAGDINGMYRGMSFGISEDLHALVSNPLIVICAGVMPIFDLPATLTYLEAMSVPVIGYGTDEFPAFFSRDSGLDVSINLDAPEDVVMFAKAHWKTGSQSAVLVANPVPVADAISMSEMKPHVEQVYKEAQEYRILGQNLAPFFLHRVNQLTGGKSMRANLSLLLNNTHLAAQIARALRTSERRHL